MLGNELGDSGRVRVIRTRQFDTLMVVNFPTGPINCHHGDVSSRNSELRYLPLQVPKH